MGGVRPLNSARHPLLRYLRNVIVRDGGGDVAYTFSVFYFFSWFLQIPLTFLGFISGFIGIGAAYAPEQRRASKRGIFLNLSPWVVDTIIFLVTLILIASDF